MKNKKMVATLASLCLIVVAVVAAVVGVLAAVNQEVKSSFTVYFTARNVYADVELDSLGPVYTTGRANQATYTGTGTAGAADSVSFLPLDQQTVGSLEAPTYDFGWANESETSAFLGRAIYRFKFTNNSGHSLQVTPSWNIPSDANIVVKFYSSAEDDLALTDITGDWNHTTGQYSGLGITASLLTEDYSEWTSGNLSVAAKDTNPGELYFYMVVALANATSDMGGAGVYFVNIGGDSMSSGIRFALADTTVDHHAS